MTVQVEVTQITLHTIVHSLMVHAQVLEAYIHSELMYTAYNIYGTTNQILYKQRRRSDYII